jgi:hypothetical protein
VFLKKDPNDGPTRDNMLRLQNKTRMNMQAFDMHWYALGLEQPPQAMGQVRRAPKGFREPPKGENDFRKGFRQAPKKKKKGG